MPVFRLSIRNECKRARIAILDEKTPLSADMRPWMLAEFGNPAAPDTVLPLVAASLRENSTGNVAQKFGPYTDLGESAPVNAVHRIDRAGCSAVVKIGRCLAAVG